MPVNALVTPRCCERVQQTKSVFLQYDLNDLLDGSYQHKEPIWCCRAFSTKANEPIIAQASNCPHCGEPLPKLRHRQLTIEMVCVVGDKATCDTCQKKLCKCRCLAPEHEYEPDDRVDQPIPPPQHTRRW